MIAPKPCVLCGGPIKPPIDLTTGLPCEGMAPDMMGCNPWPLAEEGKCCHECDDWVIAARLGHSIATGLRFVQVKRFKAAVEILTAVEAVRQNLASKNGGAR